MQSQCDNTTTTTVQSTSRHSTGQTSTVNPTTLLKRHSGDIAEWLRAIQFYPEIEQYPELSCADNLIEHEYIRRKVAQRQSKVLETVATDSADVCIRHKSDKTDRQLLADKFKCIYVENPNFPYLQLTNEPTPGTSGEEPIKNSISTSTSSSTSSSLDTCTFLLSDADGVSESHEQLNNLNIQTNPEHSRHNRDRLNIHDDSVTTSAIEPIQQCQLCGEQINRVRLKLTRFSYPPSNDQSLYREYINYDNRYLNQDDEKITDQQPSNVFNHSIYCLKCIEYAILLNQFVKKMQINRIFDNGKKRNSIPKPPIRKRRLRQRHVRRNNHSDSESDETDAQNEFICQWYVSNDSDTRNQPLTSIAESCSSDSVSSSCVQNDHQSDGVYQNICSVRSNSTIENREKDLVYQNLDLLSRSTHATSFNESCTVHNNPNESIYQNVSEISSDSVQNATVTSNLSESIYENIWELKSHSHKKTIDRSNSTIKYEKFENDSNATSSTNSLFSSYDKSHDLQPPDYEFEECCEGESNSLNQIPKIENKRQAIDFEYYCNDPQSIADDRSTVVTSSDECIYENLSKSEPNLPKIRAIDRDQTWTPVFVSKYKPLPLCTAEEINFTFESATPIYDSLLLTPTKLKQLSNRAQISTHIYRLTADIAKWKIDLIWKYSLEPDIMEDKSLEELTETCDDTALIQYRRTEFVAATSSTSTKSRHQSLLPGQTPVLWVGDRSGISKHGKFYRTKIIDCNRKQKKWVQSTYGCLINESLLLFDTEHHFEIWQQNPSLNAGLISMEMDLSCCEVRKKSDHTSTRKNVLILVNTENKSEVLIHFENEKEFKLWQEIVNSAIHLAMVPKVSARLQATLLESPVDEKPATGPSKEQRKIKDKLRNFFAGRRPSVEDLIQTGIYKDTLFGSDLEIICKSMPRPKVPKFVRVCIEAIEPFIDIEGLYRASGNIAHIQRIRLEVDQNEYGSIDANKVDIHVLTGALKLFFRELKTSLIPPGKYENFSALLEGDIDRINIVALRDIVRTFPDAHFDTLEFLMRHLLKVSQHERHNRMDITNLATVWAPNLLQMKMSGKDQGILYVQCSLQRKLICALLLNFHTIFS